MVPAIIAIGIAARRFEHAERAHIAVNGNGAPLVGICWRLGHLLHRPKIVGAEITQGEIGRLSINRSSLWARCGALGRNVA